MNKKIILRSILIPFAFLFTNLSTVDAQWNNDPAQGLPVSTALYEQGFKQMVSDGADGAIITWQDSSAATGFDIRAQRFNNLGVAQWATNGIIVCNAAGDQFRPDIVSDGSGGAIITWYDQRNGTTNSDIYAQKVTSTGSLAWAANGVAICTAANNQLLPSLASDNNGGAIIAWQDFRSATTYDIYAQRIGSAGAVMWNADGVVVSNAASNQTTVAITTDGSAGAIMMWSDIRNGNNDIYAQRCNSLGDVQWTVNGVPVCSEPGIQISHVIKRDGSGGAFVCWADGRSDAKYDIYAQHLNSSGVNQWIIDGAIVVAGANRQQTPRLETDGQGGIIVVWQDSSATTGYDIRAQRLNAAGSPQWIAQGVVVCAAANDQINVRVDDDGRGGIIAAWSDKRNGTDYNIFAQRILGNGTPHWATDGVVICSAPNDQNFSRQVSTSLAGSIISWNDNRTDAYGDIYAAMVDSNGVLVGGNRLQDSLALVALYDSTGGPTWTNKTNWKTNNPITNWAGVGVTGGRVVSVELDNNNLVGFIPSAIGNLTAMYYLRLGFNQITGQLPNSFSNLIGLEYLLMENNLLNGALSSSVGAMTNLKQISLENNGISGALPPEMGNLTNVFYVNISNNNLTGAIPTSFGNLGKLEQLYLFDNLLTGDLPPQIVNASKIKVLSFGANRLTGLPNLNPLDSLQSLSVELNRLTFEDIEPNLSAASQTFNYSPQDSIGLYKDTSIVQGNNLNLSVTVGGANNQYQWFRNGNTIPGATSSSYPYSAASAADTGNYYCRITNTLATDLTLFSRRTRIAVLALPSTPGSLSANAVSSSQINLSWGASSDVTKYRIFRSLTSGTGFAQIDSVNAPAGSYNNTGLTAFTTYFYRIVAVNQYGVSPNSNETSATTNAVALALGTPNLSNPSPIPSAAVTVSVTCSGTNPTVKLFYGKTSQVAGDSLSMTFNGSVYSATIPGASITQEGAWYRIRAQNIAGITYYPSAAGKAGIPVTINDLTTIWDNSLYYGGIPDKQYFSIALSMEGSLSLVSLWGAQTLEDGVPTNWRAWRFDTGSQSFLDVSTLTGNEAYCVFHRRGSPQEIFNSVTTPKTSDPLLFNNFVLKGGWNSVPWPYTFPANLVIKDANQDSIGSVWKLYGNAGWEQVTELRSFGGYMIYNKTGGDILLGNVVSWTQLTPKRNAGQNDGWRLRFIAESGEYRDSYNFAGVDQNYQTLSEPEPLNMDKSIDLHFKQNAAALSSDIRSISEDGHVWEMVVQNTTGNDKSKLTWELESLPPDVKAVLIDITNNEIIDVNGQNSVYDFRSQKQNTFKLIAGKTDYVDREVNVVKASLPGEFNLSQNYPNPFNPETQIKFDVARSGNISIKVYNILGQEIVTLANGYFETGRDYSVNWNGKDQLGRPVASGLYIYRLEAGKIAKTKKMLLVK
ncbi:fibronectin type III domain-containing protein [bacterium]|nr:fibronectin type III domain-containing protein [bacterium]